MNETYVDIKRNMHETEALYIHISLSIIPRKKIESKPTCNCCYCCRICCFYSFAIHFSELDISICSCYCYLFISSNSRIADKWCKFNDWTKTCIFKLFKWILPFSNENHFYLACSSAMVIRNSWNNIWMRN